MAVGLVHRYACFLSSRTRGNGEKNKERVRIRKRGKGEERIFPWDKSKRKDEKDVKNTLKSWKTI